MEETGTSKFYAIYETLFAYYGPLHWWPGESPLEISIGAILTQNTGWTNVEKALYNLKQSNVLNVPSLQQIAPEALAELIRPAGFYRAKTSYIKNFIAFLTRQFGGSFERMAAQPSDVLRPQLLMLKGIGPETADAILLYVCARPAFVIDAYTRRIFSRHGLTPENAPYLEIQAHFTAALPIDSQLYNEYHAQIVMIGKTFCKRSQPDCAHCPLNIYLPATCVG